MKTHSWWPIGLFVALTGFSSACKKPVMETSRSAYIVGPTRDIIPLDRGSEARISPDIVNASVLIATRIAERRFKFCSGTLVEPATVGGSYRVLSNHHCFAKTDADQKATADLMAEACVQTKVYLGFLPGQAASALVAGCEPGSLRTNFDGDLSVFALSGPLPPKYKPLSIYEGADSGAGRRALIVHFPDMPGNLEFPPDEVVRLPAAAATIDDCQVVGEFDVAEWSLDRTLPYSIRHTCDLIHGSSGSGLIDAETGVLLGVNWGGIKLSYDDAVRTDNVATKASYVRAFLANRLEVEVAVTANKRQADTAALAKAAPVQRKAPAIGQSPKIRSCGVAALGSSINSRANWLTWLLIWSPIMLIWWAGRRTRTPLRP